MFENGVLGKIFGFKGHGEIGDWRIFHNEEVHDFQSSPVLFSGDHILTNNIQRMCHVCGEFKCMQNYGGET